MSGDFLHIEKQITPIESKFSEGFNSADLPLVREFLAGLNAATDKNFRIGSVSAVVPPSREAYGDNQKAYDQAFRDYSVQLMRGDSVVTFFGPLTIDVEDKQGLSPVARAAAAARSYVYEVRAAEARLRMEYRESHHKSPMFRMDGEPELDLEVAQKARLQMEAMILHRLIASAAEQVEQGDEQAA